MGNDITSRGKTIAWNDFSLYLCTQNRWRACWVIGVRCWVINVGCWMLGWCMINLRSAFAMPSLWLCYLSRGQADKKQRENGSKEKHERPYVTLKPGFNCTILSYNYPKKLWKRKKLYKVFVFSIIFSTFAANLVSSDRFALWRNSLKGSMAKENGGISFR